MKRFAAELVTDGKSVIMAASTGAAALRLQCGAKTVHSLFRLSARLAWIPPLTPNTPAYQTLLRADYIISMLTAEVMNLAKHRINSVRATASEVSSNVKDLFVGDLQQLPPVCKHKDDDGICRACHTTSCCYWNTVLRDASLP